MQIKYKTTSTHLKFALTIAISFFSLFAKAQTTDSVRIAINNILAPLDKTLIPTGILAENTYPLLDMSVYNGQLTADNTIDFSQWRLLYNQALSGAYVAPVGLPDIDQLNTDYTTASNNSLDNVVSLSLINYASIKPTAITDGYMYESNGQLYDGTGPAAKPGVISRPSIGPYQTNRLFIAAAANNTAQNGVLNLLFKPSLFYTNTGLTVSNMEVDFGNGNGFVNAGFNTTLTGAYTSIGNKQFIYKITFNDGTIFQCYNTVYVPFIPSSLNASRYAGAGTTATGADIPDVIINSPTHSGVDLFIRRSISNTLGSNTNPQFRKPLIIVEGLDLSSATTLLGNGYNYNDFLREIRNPTQTSFISGTNPLQPFDQYLDDVAGYDLIFVNWHNGVDDILRNALALRDVINYVNAHKQPGAEQNVIMGISMGGLVSRYCLAQMVKSGGTGVNDHQTRLLITHDSPHRGANIPLALQHLLQGLRKQTVKAFLGIYNKRLDEIVPKFKDVNTAINSPAATQQLLARVIDDNGTVAYNTFLDGDYSTMVNFAGTGYTQPYRFVATSNGSQCGVPLAAPFSQLASLDADGTAILFGCLLWTKGTMHLDMRRLPDLGQTNRILDFNLRLKVKILFYNLLKISMEIQQNAPGNLLPLDGLAGGTRNLGGATLSSNLNNIQPASGMGNWFYITYYDYNYNTPFVAPTFSFVPTTSSLDIADFNAVNIPYSVATTGLNGSRSANYIAQEKITLPSPVGTVYNVTHTDFYARTCNWLYNEMQNIPQTTTCQDFCIDDLKITPDEGICGNSNTYHIANLPPGATVAWSVTPTGIVTPNTSNANPVTLTRVTSGTVTLAANVTLPCSNTPGNTISTVNFSKVLQVGDVGFTGTYVTSQNSNPISFTGSTSIFVNAQRGQYVSVSFNIASVQNLTNLRWSTNGTQINGYGSLFNFGINASNYQYSSTNTNIYLYADSPCGPVQYIFGFNVFSSLRMIVTASPNPVTSKEINLSITKEDDKSNGNKNIQVLPKVSNPYTKITITQVNSNIPAKTLLFKENINTNYKINTAGLTAGIYAVTVERDNLITTTKIIVL